MKLSAAKVTVARAINKADRPVTARNRDLKGVPACASHLGLRVGCEVIGAVSMVSPGVVSFSYESANQRVLRQFCRQTPRLLRGYAFGSALEGCRFRAMGISLGNS